MSNCSKCRACLKNINSVRKKTCLFDIFYDKSSKTDNNVRISELFQKYTSILISKNDSLPEYICTGCYKTLKDFHEFYKECNASNQKLLQQQNSIENRPFEHRDEEAFVQKIEPQELFQVLIKEEIEVPTDSEFEQNIDNTQVNETEKTEPFDDDSDYGFEPNDESDYGFGPDESIDNVDNQPEEKPLIKKPKRKRRSTAKYTCETCRKYFTVQHRYDAHMRMHEGLKPFLCKICSNDFVSYGFYTEHMRVNHPTEGDESSTGPRYICDVSGCGKTFKLKVFI